MLAAGLTAAGLASAASAQMRPSLSAEVGTDDRRRGLSWSDGRASARAAAGLATPGGLRLDAAVAALRGSDRHGGADAGFDLSAGWQGEAGVMRFDAAVVGHLFAGGHGPLDYAEAQVGARTLVGPVELDVSASYAPRQRAIGGDNLHLAADARVAVIGTPFTVSAGIGRSSGSVRDPARSIRLRPRDTYIDWRLGVEHVARRLRSALIYSGTNVGDDAARHAGDRLIARVTLTL